MKRPNHGYILLGPGAAVGGMRTEINTGYSCCMTGGPSSRWPKFSVAQVPGGSKESGPSSHDPNSLPITVILELVTMSRVGDGAVHTKTRISNYSAWVWIGFDESQCQCNVWDFDPCSEQTGLCIAQHSTKVAFFWLL